MESLYSRNRIYLSPSEQALIREKRILLGGAGLGSDIAECSLRLGFEKITIIDGDKIELSNLNRQNYTRADVGRYKAEALADRLLSINPNADIKYYCEYIDKTNMDRLVCNCDIAINALDFKDTTPFDFDKRCRDLGVYVIHPYNFGWGGMILIVSPLGIPISYLFRHEPNCKYEFEIAKYIDGYSQFWNIPENKWLHEVLNNYQKEDSTLPNPQLSVGAWIAAALTTNALVEISLNRPVKECPKFYLASFLGDRN
jgi:hypothetical protein